MLKKSVAMLMVMLYTVTAMGFALNVHYCGNTRLSVEVNKPAKSCMMGKLPVKMKCCKDNRIDIKVKDSHQAESISFLAKIFANILPAFPFKEFASLLPFGLSEQPTEWAPPNSYPAQVISAFLRNCNFRI